MRRLILYLGMAQILILFGITLTVVVGIRLAYPSQSPDPFRPYEAMMPGEWVLATGKYPCETDLIPGNIETLSCDLHPTDGRFISVSSSIYDGSFVSTWFNAADLHVGDIIRHWGQPDTVEGYYDRAFYVAWKDQGLVGFIFPVGSATQFNYLLQVERFAIGLEPSNLH